MDTEIFEKDILESLQVLRNGGIILYPTDTVWGIGCDATNEAAVQKIYALKKRSEKKSMIVLVSSEREMLQYVAALDLSLFDFLKTQERPTTVICDGALHLASNLINEDGSIAIRKVDDDFCRHLIKRLQKPIVSTSANFSGSPTPKDFSEIEEGIKNGVDYVVKYRQNDTDKKAPSQIIKWEKGGKVTYIRK